MFADTLRNVLTADQCGAMVAQGLHAEMEQATVGKDRDVNAAIRRSQVMWLDRERGDVGIVRKRVRSWMRLQGIAIGPHEEWQLTRYDAGVAGKYAAHMDVSEHDFDRRRVSVTVLLTDPADYAGGELSFPHLPRMAEQPLRRGDAAVFRSWLAHEVKPVYEGQRWSLVAWLG